MKSASKAQARRLADLWSSERREILVCVSAPHGREPYNDSTIIALMKRGWIVPNGDPVPRKYNAGYLNQPYCLSWEGMKALAEFITTEVRLSDNSAQQGGSAA